MRDGCQLWLDWHRLIARDNEAEIKALEADRGEYGKTVGKLESGFVLSLRWQTLKPFPSSDRLRVAGIFDLDPRKRIWTGLGLADNSFQACLHTSSKNLNLKLRCR